MNEIIRVRAIYCCSRVARLHLNLQVSRARFVVGNGSAACSSTTTAKPHEYFDRTGSKGFSIGLPIIAAGGARSRTYAHFRKIQFSDHTRSDSSGQRPPTGSLRARAIQSAYGHLSHSILTIGLISLPEPSTERSNSIRRSMEERAVQASDYKRAGCRCPGGAYRPQHCVSKLGMTEP